MAACMLDDRSGADAEASPAIVLLYRDPEAPRGHSLTREAQLALINQASGLGTEDDLALIRPSALQPPVVLPPLAPPPPPPPPPVDASGCYLGVLGLDAYMQRQHLALSVAPMMLTLFTLDGLQVRGRGCGAYMGVVCSSVTC